MKNSIFITFLLAFTFTSHAFAVKICDSPAEKWEARKKVQALFLEQSWPKTIRYLNKKGLSKTMARAYVESICGMIAKATESFTLTDDNFPKIVSYFSSRGHEVVGNSRVLVYPKITNKFYFDVEMGFVPRTTFIPPNLVAVGYFSFSDPVHYTRFKDEIDRLIEVQSSLNDFNFLNKAVSQLNKEHLGSGSIILLDDFFWNHSSASDQQKKLSLVYALSQKMAYEKNPSAFIKKSNTTGELDLEDEDIVQIQNLVDNSYEEQKKRLAKLAPIAHYYPSKEELLDILEEVYLEGLISMNDANVVSALQEEMRYFFSLGKTCVDYAKAYIQGTQLITVNFDYRYFYAPALPKEGKKVMELCNEVEGSIR